MSCIHSDCSLTIDAFESPYPILQSIVKSIKYPITAQPTTQKHGLRNRPRPLPPVSLTQRPGTDIRLALPGSELLYRLLWDILNRLAAHLHKFAVERLDQLGSFLEQRALARQESTRATESGKPDLEILSEVGKLAEESGFITCPMGGVEGRGRRPPSWVLSVLQAAHEGRIESREFWINGLVG
jgi:hypothetical protein